MLGISMVTWKVERPGGSPDAGIEEALMPGGSPNDPIVKPQQYKFSWKPYNLLAT